MGDEVKIKSADLHFAWDLVDSFKATRPLWNVEFSTILFLCNTNSCEWASTPFLNPFLSRFGLFKIIWYILVFLIPTIDECCPCGVEMSAAQQILVPSFSIVSERLRISVLLRYLLSSPKFLETAIHCMPRLSYLRHCSHCNDNSWSQRRRRQWT